MAGPEIQIGKYVGPPRGNRRRGPLGGHPHALVVLTILILFVALPLAAPSAKAKDVTFVIEMKSIRFNPTLLVVDPGDSVTLIVFNNDTQGHTFDLPDFAIHLGTEASPMQPGTNQTANFVASTVGTYWFYCSIPGHATPRGDGTWTGMAGRLVVGATPAPSVGALSVWLITLRWIHFFAGITWIGLLYYFNFVQVPTFKELDAATKNVLIPRLVKRALLWFRISASVTVLAGWVYFLSVWAAGNFYDVTTAWWAVSILAGGLIGTFMLINVWGVIWRYQKQIIAATEALAKGTPAPPDMPKWGKRALIASRMNVAMSLPLLFFMAAASHLPLF